MTATINFDHSSADREAGICWLHIDNPDKPGGDFLGAFQGYSDEGSPDETWWTWENPDEPLESVTFSPSIILHFGDTQMFHVFVRDGELDHCGDCECGCLEDSG